MLLIPTYLPTLLKPFATLKPLPPPSIYWALQWPYGAFSFISHSSIHSAAVSQLLLLIKMMKVLLSSVVTAAVVPTYSLGWDDWGWGGGGRTPTHSPKPQHHPSSNTWSSPSWWGGDGPTDWVVNGWNSDNNAWTGDVWNNKQKPILSPTPSPLSQPSGNDDICECPGDLSEEDCQAYQDAWVIPLAEQSLQIFELLEKLNEVGGEPTDLINQIPQDLTCEQVFVFNAKVIAILEQEILIAELRETLNELGGGDS